MCWLALLAGVVLWLRASGRGRRGWEPVTVVVVAGLLPVWMCVQTFFHPQDLLALGLGLAGMACARRDRWLAAGVLCALAVLSQQFALLIAIPLVVLAPAARRTSFVAAGVATGAIVVVPLAIMTSGHVLRAIMLGSGDNPTLGGTVLWETRASGAFAVLLFRVAPVAASLALAWWVARRLGSAALAPVPLLSLVAVSLGLRLAFEANMLTYYFMALTVSLVLLDVTRGSIRRSMVAWLAVLVVVMCSLSGFPFGTVGWGVPLQDRVLPLAIGAGAVLAIVAGLRQGRGWKDLSPWVCVTLVVLCTQAPDANSFIGGGRVLWLWQLVLTVPALVFAAQPLRAALRDRAPGTGVPDSASTLHSAP